MEAVGIAERTRPPATVAANGRAPEPHPSADPTMTRAASEAWRRDLEALYHFDPDYHYDPGHEYDLYWTTDPTYRVEERMHLCRYDADGVEVMADLRARDIQRNAGHTTFDKLGDCVELETGVHYLAPDGVVYRVHPDLMVLPRVGLLDMATGQDRALRLDRGDPSPVLVLEILSYGGMQRDLKGKLQLYERLGIPEYLVYDLGGKRRRKSPRELLLYRLVDGAYRRIDPEPKESASDPEVHWCDAFGAYIRICRIRGKNPASCRRRQAHHRASSGGTTGRTAGATGKPMPKLSVKPNETGSPRNGTGLPRNGTGSLRNGRAWPSP